MARGCKARPEAYQGRALAATAERFAAATLALSAAAEPVAATAVALAAAALALAVFNQAKHSAHKRQGADGTLRVYSVYSASL